MLNEPSTLASVSILIGETLQNDYGIGPTTVFAAAGMEYRADIPAGERISSTNMSRLWQAAIAATGDPMVGLHTGLNARPGHFYAFGYSWLASETLLDAMQRLCRYDKVIATYVSSSSITRRGDNYVVTESYPDPALAPGKEKIDFGLGAFVAMCDAAIREPVPVLRWEISADDKSQCKDYEELLRAPVSMGHAACSAYFARDVVEAPLYGRVDEVAAATDRIVENYLETLDQTKVTSKVRELLVDLLPSGNAHQHRIAQRLHKSTSSLQRQLQTEGTSYREVLEKTRSSLAREYLQDDKYSHAQIAYLLGFSDQSNFSRAFKRWNGMGPKQFQETATPGHAVIDSK